MTKIGPIISRKLLHIATVPLWQRGVALTYDFWTKMVVLTKTTPGTSWGCVRRPFEFYGDNAIMTSFHRLTLLWWRFLISVTKKWLQQWGKSSSIRLASAAVTKQWGNHGAWYVQGPRKGYSASEFVSYSSARSACYANVDAKRQHVCRYSWYCTVIISSK